MPNLNGKILSGVPVLLPSIDEQRQIGQSLIALDNKMQAEERKRKSLEALFQSLLHHLMTGKLRVKDLDPTDHSHHGTAVG